MKSFVWRDLPAEKRASGCAFTGEPNRAQFVKTESHARESRYDTEHGCTAPVAPKVPVVSVGQYPTVRSDLHAIGAEQRNYDHQDGSTRQDAPNSLSNE